VQSAILRKETTSYNNRNINSKSQEDDFFEKNDEILDKDGYEDLDSQVLRSDNENSKKSDDEQ
jgi:hypothetical protein